MTLQVRLGLNLTNACGDNPQTLLHGGDVGYGRGEGWCRACSYLS